VNVLLKSIALGLVGAALFFCFFMMFSIPVLTVMAKLHDPNAPLQAPDVVLAPTALFRGVGVPLSGAAFVVCFVLAMKKLRKSSAVEDRVIRRSGDRVI
jgi:cytochrome c biogenesis factor